MDNLYAPWRVEYIKGPRASGCFLCAALRGSDDKASLLVHRGKTCGIILNRFPYNGGHVLVFPHRHVDDLTLLTDEESAEMHLLACRCIRAVRGIMSPQGFNLGINMGSAAGAGLEEHLHLHLLPRWRGDTNFMSTVAATKVIPNPLDRLWEDLRAALAET